jgi:hypothetical protein
MCDGIDAFTTSPVDFAQSGDTVLPLGTGRPAIAAIDGILAGLLILAACLRCPAHGWG